jgi:sulfite exporter TauE/SafE
MLAALCGPGGIEAVLNGGLVLGLLVAGAAGSVVHCVPMCGPFVLGQVSDRLARVPAARLCEASRIASGMLLPYHLGRITTYAGLGALAAMVGGALARLSWLGPLAGVLLLVGALLFLAQAVKRSAPWLPRLAPSTGPMRWRRTIGRLARRIDRSRPQGGFLLGVILGFLPCGFLYGALAVAAASGSAPRGAIAMLAFGLGTVPSLMAVGVAGQAFGRGWHSVVAAVSPVVLVLNAVVLAALAVVRLTA